MNLNNAFTPGAVIGSTPFQLGASIGTYAIGRALGNSCVARVGADLIQAQVMAETLTMIFKQAARRSPQQIASHRPGAVNSSVPATSRNTSRRALVPATTGQPGAGQVAGAAAVSTARPPSASAVPATAHHGVSHDEGRIREPIQK